MRCFFLYCTRPCSFKLQYIAELMQKSVKHIFVLQKTASSGRSAGCPVARAIWSPMFDRNYLEFANKSYESKTAIFGSIATCGGLVLHCSAGCPDRPGAVPALGARGRVGAEGGRARAGSACLLSLCAFEAITV